MQLTLKHSFRVLALLGGLALLVPLIALLYTRAATASFRAVTPADTPVAHVAVVFGAGVRVLVTQRYHLPRAVYTCRALGVEAVGYGVADWGRYAPLLLARYTAREALATVKALVDVHLARPLPTFLGPYEGLE